MKTTVDIYNEMCFTYHWASPYTLPYWNNDIRWIIEDAIYTLATTGEYH